MNTFRPASRLVRPHSLTGLRGTTFSELFDTFFNGSVLPRFAEAVRTSDFVPTLEWTDRGADYLLRAEIPGLDVEHVELALEDDMLVLRGEKRSEERTENDKVLMSERSFGSFERRLRLPGAVDADAIAATMKNGVLEVVLPKAAEKDGSRRIEIKR
jgi:HSP20 family protein